MKEIAFYIMNSKGYFVLKSFVDKFGSENISYIVSSEDKNIKKDYYCEIQTLADDFQINFFNRCDDFLNIESSFQGYKFSISWRWLIKNEFNLIIFHDSLLPKYRGFAPLVNSLVNNESLGGVTALFANSEYDRGDIISQKSFAINYPIKIKDVIEIVEPLYFYLLEDIYRNIVDSKKLRVIKQDEEKATYSLWLDSEDYFIDWSWSAKKIKRFVDATGYPYDGAKAYLKKEVVKFIDIEILEDVDIEHRNRQIGKVIFIKDDIPVVVCKKGLISLIDIRDEKDEYLMINFRSKFE